MNLPYAAPTKFTIVAPFLLIFSLGLSSAAPAQDHPNLLLTKAGVFEIRRHLGQVPLFDQSVAEAKRFVDEEIAQGIDVPIPKDFSGGYTHEKHKRNYAVAQQAGALFQILEDDKYAQFVRAMLFEYESMYATLPLHPKERSYSRGKLFWQCLNDANWLLHMALAYDAIYDWLSPEDREQLNRNLFRPFADFLSLGNPQFFNRIHNHSTWATAAVGMIGLVMNDDVLIERALYGIDDQLPASNVKDDDGGFLRVEGQEAGFLANLEEPFSPDGYFTEGPYYQRYAMYPFLVFALALENAMPKLGVFQYKDDVLLKAVNTLMNLTDTDGEFFAMNDAQKGMSYFTRSLILAVDVAYYFGNKDPSLLSIAEQQGGVLLDESGLAVAKAIAHGEAKPFVKTSRNFSDGPNGNRGGVAVMRDAVGDLAVVFKYTAHGLSHGHFDKLSYSMFLGGAEVIQDYGLARFVNIGAKGGGNYLPENASWAKQTVAHNTLIVDQSSHFDGQYEIGSQHHSELYALDFSNTDQQFVSAIERNAYPGVSFHRTLAMIKDPTLSDAILIDVLNVRSDTEHRYDLPTHYLGQIIGFGFENEASSLLEPLGDEAGYQHLFVEGRGKQAAGSSYFTWLNEGRFFSQTYLTRDDDMSIFARLGANDPNFNLRRDPVLIQRRDDSADTIFASVVESHGHYSPVSELAVNASRSVQDISLVVDTESYTALSINLREGGKRIFVIANNEPSNQAEHKLDINGVAYRWRGPFFLGGEPQMLGGTSVER